METEIQTELKPAVCFLTTFASQFKEKVCSVSKIAIQMLSGTKKEENLEENAEPKDTCRQSIKKISAAVCKATQLNKIDPLMRNLLIIGLVASIVLLGPLTTLVALTGLALARIMTKSQKINSFIENNKPVLFATFALSCYAFSAGVLPVAFAIGYLVNGILRKNTSEFDNLSPIKLVDNNNGSNDDLF